MRIAMPGSARWARDRHSMPIGRTVFCSLSMALMLGTLGCGGSPTAPSAPSAKDSAVDSTTATASAEKNEPREIQLTAGESRGVPAPAAKLESESQEPARLPESAEPVPLIEADAAALTMPVLALTQGHAATCRVQVGDTFPNLQLPDTGGQAQTLSALLGPRLTVVFFWNGKKPTTLEELKDLSDDVVKRFGTHGVKVVGISTQDDPQLASELVKQSGAVFPNLCDVDGQAYAQVATGKSPRTYLIDTNGKIVWFDLEYSPTTRRDLTQAIRFTLTH